MEASNLKFVAFDLEIAKVLPEGEEFGYASDLGISVAATYKSNGDGHVWHSLPNDQLTFADALALVYYLNDSALAGYTPLTWNGAAFDFRLLADQFEGQEVRKLIAELALTHWDPMFQVLCLKGHPLSLKKVARALRVPGKSLEVEGADAPRLWAEGEYGKVMRYVARDALATANVAEGIVSFERPGPGVPWMSTNGRPRFCPFPDGLLTVGECLKLPPVKALEGGPTRESATGWIKEVLDGKT